MSFIEGSTNGAPTPLVLSSRICSITYDKLTLIGSYQLSGISSDNGGIGFLDRVFMDPEGNHVSILKYGSYSRAPGGAANDWTTTMSIATTYSAPSELALSLSWANVPDPAYSSNLDIGSACISTADGMIIENGTKTCSATRKTAKNSNAIELLGTAAKLRNTSPTPAYWILKADSDAYAVFLPSFNGSTIVTAPLGLPSN